MTSFGAMNASTVVKMSEDVDVVAAGAQVDGTFLVGAALDESPQHLPRSRFDLHHSRGIGAGVRFSVIADVFHLDSHFLQHFFNLVVVH